MTLLYLKLVTLLYLNSKNVQLNLGSQFNLFDIIYYEVKYGDPYIVARAHCIICIVINFIKKKRIDLICKCFELCKFSVE